MWNKKVTIVGAGLAGTEAALQLSKHGYEVTLFEQKKIRKKPVYHLKSFAELVCNNSLGPVDSNTPLGLLRSELTYLRSELVQIAGSCRIQDNKNFSVDKSKFSSMVTESLKKSGVHVVNAYIEKIPGDRPLIIATGPLSDESLLNSIAEQFCTRNFHFADASSPVVDINSININSAGFERLSDDLYSLTIPENLFENFRKELAYAEKYKDHMNIEDQTGYENCYSIEHLAREKNNALREMRFTQESGGKSPVLLLRRESAMQDAFLLVGCMTMLNHHEQKRIFSMLPGFEKCKFLRYGRMHRNSYFDSPGMLDCFYRVRKENVYIIGQLSGIDGYLAAISSGLVAAYRVIRGKDAKPFPISTMIGTLANYVTNTRSEEFRPMGASFALMQGGHDVDEEKEMGLEEYKM